VGPRAALDGCRISRLPRTFDPLTDEPVRYLGPRYERIWIFISYKHYIMEISHSGSTHVEEVSVTLQGMLKE
jgi:hypothetical protein